ncbi:hypothetical protein EMCRGX_G001235 [Ephydatia muelleri]
MEINTGQAEPKRTPLRRMPFAVREEVARQVKKLLDTRVITPSESPWSSPVVLVRKKDGCHFCVDYRNLNAVTKADTFPLPRVDDLLDQLYDCKYFSTLDLAAGFWQIRVHQKSMEKTAFATPQGLFEFRVMPFGLTNAPSVFQRLMQKVLMGLNPENGPDFVSVYIDNILVFLSSLEEHIHHLQLVLEQIITANLKLKPSKCRFVREEVEYLGHVITRSGLKTQAKHVEAVQHFARPNSLKGVRQYLGMCAYYRRCIPCFSGIARPLHNLTRKGADFVWTEECETAFRELMERLTAAPVLAYPCFQKPFILETDASGSGLGAVLSQCQDDGLVHPIAYASRSLCKAESNYGITELETLAVVWALTHVRTYIYGNEVTVYTDHSAVKAVLETPNPSGKHARWWSKVYESGAKHVHIIYKSGKSNSNADALSRSPVGTPGGEADEEVQVTVVQSRSISHILESSPTVGELSDLKEEQRKDPSIQEIIAFLQQNVLPADEKKARKMALQGPLFCIVDDILYFVDQKKDGGRRVVLPKQLQRKVMEECHGGKFGGHFSGARLYNQLSRHWWWENMHADIVTFCKSCPECATATGGCRPSKPHLSPIPVQRPFQIIGLDLMELPVTSQGNRYVVVFQDFLTKWPMVYPVPDQKTERIVKLLTEEIVNVCKLLGIKKLNTTAYHPQCDGMVERFNRTLKTMLRKQAAVFGNQWDRYLSGVLWAYRNTAHDSTQEKPSFLLFGVDCRTPTEAAILPPKEVQTTNVEDYREELVLCLSTARKHACDALKKAQQRYKQQYDKHCHPVQYKVGDWIMVRFPQDESGKSRKLSRPWHGPYRVQSCDSPDVVASKMYFPEEGSIQVHQTRTTPCYPGFPNGFYWYGKKQTSQGHYPQWIDSIVPASSGAADGDSEDTSEPTTADDDTADQEPDDTADQELTRDQHTLPPVHSRQTDSTRYSLRKQIRTPKRYL